jgi:hypothetical protein
MRAQEFPGETAPAAARSSHGSAWDPENQEGLAPAGGTAGDQSESFGQDHAAHLPGTRAGADHRPRRLSAAEREDGRMVEAERRLGVLIEFSKLVSQGNSPRMAARTVGESRATIWRWQKRYEASGFNGLIPKTRNCGRLSAAEKVGLAEEEIKAVQGIHLDTDSNTSALRVFAQSDRCRPELAAVILDPNRTSKHSIPPSIRAATKVNENLKKAHRGPRKLALNGMWTPRKLDILPGDIFTSDDTTPIWAWWVPWVECEDYPFGVKVLQGQFLPVLDVASQCIVSLVLIAREKASYRAADIWNLFGHTFDHVGLPRLGWQIERGSWDANLIRGEEVIYEDGEITRARRAGGLRSLPANVTDWHKAGPFQHLPEEALPKTQNIWTSYLPKSKSIEAWFNRNQALEGTLWGSLGRDQMRNPYEKTKKIYEACKRGAADPRLHFLSQTEMLQRVKSIVEYINNEPVEGEVFRGIPKQLFNQAVEERPLFRLPERERYLYRRNWKTLTITQGWARVRETDPITERRYSLFYSAPSVFAHYEGQPVIVYFDRENYDSPAQVHLARDGSFLCEAQYEDRRGSFLEGDLSGHDLRKQWRNAVMSAYATLTPHIPSRQIPAEVQARREENRAATRALEREEKEFPTKGLPQASKPIVKEPEFVGDLRMQILMEK